MKHTEQLLAKRLPYDAKAAKQGASVLQALNHDLRQRIIRLIHIHGCMNVTDMYKKLDIEQSVMSLHLAILRKERFLLSERHGREIHYSLNFERFAKVDELNRQIVNNSLQTTATALQNYSLHELKRDSQVG